MRTLIVEDSPVIRLLLQRMLASYGESELAKDGQEAVDAYSRSVSEGPPFDLVCLDLGLPLISGADVLEKIRALEAQSGRATKSSVLVITGSSELDLVDALRRKGADGFLVKPIAKETLVGYLNTFGLLNRTAEPEPREGPIPSLEAMCDMDQIPAPALARLIQRMAGSIARQLSDHSKQTPSSTTSVDR